MRQTNHRELHTFSHLLALVCALEIERGKTDLAETFSLGMFLKTERWEMYP
jgi:hypothetical protein